VVLPGAHPRPDPLVARDEVGAAQEAAAVVTERFYVHTASGRAIVIGATTSSGKKVPLPSAYYVYDRANNHRAIAVFPESGQWANPETDRGKRDRAAAEAFAAALNAAKKETADA
jgi:hypothetical protein